MKKRFALLLTVILLVTMVLAPTANADTRLGTATVSTGANLAVLPTTENQNLVPFFGFPEGLPISDFLAQLAVVVNSRSFVPFPTRGFYEFFHDGGITLNWNYGECSIKGFRGTATMRYCTPLYYNSFFADDTPYYIFTFDADPNGPRIRYDGDWFSYGYACESILADYLRRIPSLEAYGHSFYGEGPNGEIYQFETGAPLSNTERNHTLIFTYVPAA